ncbi:hypothetical protein HYALB_00005848 [Hymenoscyphus albidus]|uniref:Nucleoside-diphosphate-sugar epimerase n=1 Tax=Hymenoscyphus albidus TaxID=595503 RepID=A0A9N9Q056_9HELO|nr:hypothetical protein HYALB_00005848 [Hymenoscyphus albidus]
MNLLLTGASGTIGSTILTQTLSNPHITSLILLVRRPLTNLALSTHQESGRKPEVKIIIMEGFNIYPDEVVDEIAGCEACIWAMGTYTGDSVVEVEYPTAFADAFLRRQREGRKGKGNGGLERKEKFRFVFLRGAYTVEDQDRSLWFMPSARRGNGLGEKTLRLYAQENACEDIWQTYIMKPGGILPSSILPSMGFILRPVMDVVGAIRSNEVAACIVDIAVHGSEDGKFVWQNGDMVLRGRAVLGE